MLWGGCFRDGGCDLCDDDVGAEVRRCIIFGEGDLVVGVVDGGSVDWQPMYHGRKAGVLLQFLE